jgi:hypothetical protein
MAESTEFAEMEREVKVGWREGGERHVMVVGET